jgi:hypothetical protein
MSGDPLKSDIDPTIKKEEKETGATEKNTEEAKSLDSSPLQSESKGESNGSSEKIEELPAPNSSEILSKPTQKFHAKNAQIREDLMGFWDFHFKNPLKRYISLVEKEVRVLVKDRAAMLIMYAIPLIVILIMTFGVNQQILTAESDGTGGFSNRAMEDLSKGEIPVIGLIDLDTSEGFPGRDLSAELTQKFIEQEELGKCDLYIATNQTELEYMLGTGKMNAFIIIPNLFEFNLSIHLPTILPFVLDTLDVMRLQSAQVVVEGVIQDFRVQNDFTGVFKTHKYNVNLPEKAQILYASAYIMFPLIVFGIGCLTSTQSIVSDIPKDRMVLTPTNKKEMMAAKVTALQIMMCGLIMVILICSAIAGLQIRGTWFDFFLVLFMISLNSVIIGVAISAISKTALSAFQYFIFIFLFQTIILFFVEDPNILRLMPVHNGALLVMGVLLRGQTYYSLRVNIYYIFGEAIIVYLISYIIFKRQQTML